MKRYLKYGIALASVCTLLKMACVAQDVHVSANIESNNIKIGEQVKLRLIAAYPKHATGIKIQWPAITDSLISKVRVVTKSKIDTIKADSVHPSLQEQRQDILITSFDSGYYAIPPFTFIVNGDTAHPQQTEPIMLYVRTVAVDTTKSIKDIKAPYTAPFSILEALPWIGLVILALLAICLTVYFVEEANKKKKPLQVIVKTPVVDPQNKALQALEELAAKKLWQEGKVKDYHSSLTDILRTYLDDRFGITAQEMITDEIVYAMRRIDIDTALKGKLKEVLVLADLVKFAKEQPLPTEHEASYINAVEFVKNTIRAKEEVQVQQAPPSPDATNQPPFQP